jgi:predicted amidophosphoribosyltransferase
VRFDVEWLINAVLNKVWYAIGHLGGYLEREYTDAKPRQERQARFAKMEREGRCWNCGRHLVGAFDRRGELKVWPDWELHLFCDRCVEEGAFEAAMKADFEKMEREGRCWRCGRDLAGVFSWHGQIRVGPDWKKHPFCDSCYKQGT